MLLTIVNSLARPTAVPVRRENLHGRPHIVVPMAMMQEGVWEGSDGPVLYTNEEFDKSIPTFNHKPIVVYHPMMNGKAISACDPDVLNTQSCGLVLNTMRDDKFRAEAWLDEERTRTLDVRILNNIEKGVVTEISTGIISDPNNESGVWTDGKPYNAKAVNMKGDHLAILPDRQGAYSVASGAGLLRVNEASFDDIRSGLRKEVSGKLGKPGQYWDGYIEDVFTDKVIIWEDGQLWQFKYTVSGSTVSLGAGPTKVSRVTEYRAADGNVIANARVVLLSNYERCHMDRKQQVDALIANSASGWADGDREFLMGLPEDKLAKFAKVRVVEVAPTPTPIANATPPVGPVPVQPAKPLTVNEFLASQPPEVAALITEGLTSLGEKRTALIGSITANKANTFTADELAAMTTPTLKKMAELAVPGGPAVTANSLGFPFAGGQTFAGLAGGGVTANAAVAETPMAMPVVFTPAK